MEISSQCEVNYTEKLPFSVEEIETFSSNFVNYVIENNLSENFSNVYNYELELMVCDNDFIHNINRDYRKIDKPTDVITFALFNDSEDKIIIDNKISLGQILISYDKVISQAKENEVAQEYEFLNLLSHGILHLLGFDHSDDLSLEYMLSLQNKMIESVQNVKI